MKFNEFFKNSITITESSDVFPDVDVIKLDPDRIDAYDIASALMPTLVRVAYVYLVDDKKKYERTHKDEDDIPFEFTEDALDELLEKLIEHVIKRLEDVSTHDRKTIISRVASEFKEKLNESLNEAKYYAGDMDSEMCEVVDSRGEQYGHYSVVFKKNGKIEVVANPGNPTEAEKKKIIEVAKKAMKE